MSPAASVTLIAQPQLNEANWTALYVILGITAVLVAIFIWRTVVRSWSGARAPAPPPPKPVPVKPSCEPLRLLTILQREGRLVDFLLEDIDGYTDQQVGA